MTDPDAPTSYTIAAVNAATSCNVLHLDGNGNQVPCPDELALRSFTELYVEPDPCDDPAAPPEFGISHRDAGLIAAGALLAAFVIGGLLVIAEALK